MPSVINRAHELRAEISRLKELFAKELALNEALDEYLRTKGDYPLVNVSGDKGEVSLSAHLWAYGPIYTKTFKNGHLDGEWDEVSVRFKENDYDIVYYPWSTDVDFQVNGGSVALEEFDLSISEDGTALEMFGIDQNGHGLKLEFSETELRFMDPFKEPVTWRLRLHEEVSLEDIAGVLTDGRALKTDDGVVMIRHSLGRFTIEHTYVNYIDCIEWNLIIDGKLYENYDLHYVVENKMAIVSLTPTSPPLFSIKGGRFTVLLD